METVSLSDLEAGFFAIIQTKWQTPHDPYCAHQNAPRQVVHVDLKFLGDPGFLLGLDSIEPGIDEYSFSEMRSAGSDLDRLVTQEDQFCPGLSNAEGSHVGFQTRRV